MRTDEVTIAAPGGTLPAHLARPDGDGPHPAVIVIHEIFGLNDDIRRIAGLFADAGYVAVAPDLLAGGNKALCVMRAMRDLRRGDGATFRDLDAVRCWLQARDDTDGSRLGVAGFCLGGGFSLLYAVRAPVGAVAPFYGEVPKRAESLDGVPPVCASAGGRDRMFAKKARRLDAHLSELGVPHDVKVYPDAGHSFMSHPGGSPMSNPILRLVSAPMSPGYHEASATDAWARMLAFFAEHLG